MVKISKAKSLITFAGLASVRGLLHLPLETRAPPWRGRGGAAGLTRTRWWRGGMNLLNICSLQSLGSEEFVSSIHGSTEALVLFNPWINRVQ
ncbi:hypothetical protein ACS0TY_010973 [Phlomoides rotata]